MPNLVKQADLVAMDRTIRGAFLDSYNSSTSYQPRWPIYGTRQPSSSKANIYPSVIDAAAIREWTEGGRTVNGLVIEGARVTNQLWELTYGLRRVDIDDDLTGTVQQCISRLQSGASKYLRHPDKLCSAVLKGNGVCLDGLTLFHASHKVNPADAASETYANTDTGTLTPTNAATCRAKMLELKSADGEPANENPAILMVPPAQELTARKIAQADVVVFGSSGDANETNVYKGMWTVVVDPRLSAAHGGNDSHWFMIDASDPQDRCVIFQERQAVEIVSMFSPTDPVAFERDEYVWGTRARYTAAGGNPKKAFRRTG